MVTWQEQWHIQVCLSGLGVVRFAVIAVTFTRAVAHSSRPQLMYHSVAPFTAPIRERQKHLYMFTMLKLRKLKNIYIFHSTNSGAIYHQP